MRETTVEPYSATTSRGASRLRPLICAVGSRSSYLAEPWRWHVMMPPSVSVVRGPRGHPSSCPASPGICVSG